MSGKRTEPGPLSKLWAVGNTGGRENCPEGAKRSRLGRWLGTIPHLFGKITVIWCVLCGTAASAYSLRILSRTGHDPAALLGVILAFFGGELMILCLKKILEQ